MASDIIDGVNLLHVPLTVSQHQEGDGFILRKRLSQRILQMMNKILFYFCESLTRCIENVKHLSKVIILDQAATGFLKLSNLPSVISAPVSCTYELVQCISYMIGVLRTCKCVDVNCMPLGAAGDYQSNPFVKGNFVLRSESKCAIDSFISCYSYPA